MIRESLPPLLALSGLALAQPLLDLFGKNPEFFVAADMGTLQIVVFAVVLVVLVPLLGLGLVALGRLVGGPTGARLVTNVLVALLAFVLGLTVARQLDVDGLAAASVLAGAIAAAVTWARIRFAGFRQALRYLALAPLAFLALFLFTSETSTLLTGSEAEAASGVQVGRPAPVVFVVMDELPVATLMRPDGSLNEERFPNFARLAEAGTWYRNAAVVTPNTTTSVPAILDGDRPEPKSLPVSATHPDTLFTLLGDSYDLDVTERISELCPSSLCEPEDQEGFISTVGRSLGDAAVVYGHASLPVSLRAELPAVDGSWGGFLEDTGPEALDLYEDASPSAPSDEKPVDFLIRRKQEGAGEFPDLPGETLRQAVAESSVEGDRDLFFVHDLFPHAPWVRTPTGAVYEDRVAFWDPASQDRGNREWIATQGLQRHLLQTGYADLALGELIDKLQANGVWDDALVVVTADHGISFTPNIPRRRPTGDNKDEVYRVPLFVKLPGQAGGVVDDAPAQSIDILPTIVEALEIESDFEFDGVSLLGDDRPADRPLAYPHGPKELPGGVEDAIAVAARNGLLLPHGDGWRAVASPGPHGHLVGERVEALGPLPGPELSWTVDQSLEVRTTVMPVVLTGQIEGAEDRFTYLVAVNGTVAGVVGLEQGDDFSAVIDESTLVRGANEVQLLEVRGPPGEPQVRTVGGPAR